MPSRRILIRSGKHPFTVVGPEASLAHGRAGVFAGNVGNFLFSHSVTKAVSAPGTEVISNSILTERPSVNDRYIQSINDEFEHFVLPMANSFKASFLPQLKILTSVIQKLTIPTTVIGVGAQLPISGTTERVSQEFADTVRDFVKVVLDRSASIGVRGQITKEFLLQLGFADSQVDVIGCPSFYVTSEPQPVQKAAAIGPESRIAVSVTRSVRRMGEILANHVDRYPHMMYVPQASEDLNLLLWGEDIAACRDLNMPSRWEHPLYQQDRIRFFLDASTWLAFMAEQEFAFGTRLHGNVAALLAGTPAVLLSHDSRTRELAEYHGMPHRTVSQVPADIDASQLYDEADFTVFNSLRADRFANYLAFLDKNDIDHIFNYPEEEQRWEQQLAVIDFPAPVQTLMARETDVRRDVVSRLQWLRQGRPVDRTREVGAYQPPFQPMQSQLPTAPLEFSP